MSIHTATAKRGVLLLSGYAIRVAVERGHLVVEDGVGSQRRVGRFARVDRELRRLVVLGHSGTISFDALRWLSDVGAGFIQIDTDGRVLVAAGPIGTQEPKLRRAQALAGENGVGLAISKQLIRTKLDRQRALVEKLPGAPGCSHAALSAALKAADAAESIERLRMAEAEGAVAYWTAWSPAEVRFVPREAASVPERWQTFGRRSSPLTASPRKAANPANALLNYLYALTEAEARLAALAVGLDPGLGVMHADIRSRDSLASDLMEPVRPLVDGWMLSLLAKSVFRKRDFFETRQGVCRVMPPTTHALAETLPRWTAALAPVAEQVAKRLLAAAEDVPRPQPRRRPVATPLTQSNRRTAHAPEGRKIKTKHVAGGRPVLALGCEVCGSDAVPPDRRCCDVCLLETHVHSIGLASAELQRRRSRGEDPAHGGEAAVKRSKKAAVNLTRIRAWDREHGRSADPEVFLREIQPKLVPLRLRDLMLATGLSEPYCSLIRQGKKVPHARHWEVFSNLVA